MGKIDGFERRKDRSKQRILKATEALIGKYGTNKVSINDIASQANVSQVTIYNLFGNKEKLIHDSMEILADSLLLRFGEILKKNIPPLDKMEEMVRFALETNEVYPGFGDIDTLNDPQIKGLSDSVLKKESNLFVEFIKNGKELGYFNPELSDEAIRVYFEFIMKGFLADHYLHAKTHSDPKLLHDLLLMVFYGFSK